MALAFHAHVISAYGGIVEGRRRLGLAPWQLRRVGDAMEAELDADHSIGRLARECGLSSSHFARAFKTTTGLAPHQWLTRRRVARAPADQDGTGGYRVRLRLCRPKPLLADIRAGGEAEPGPVAASARVTRDEYELETESSGALRGPRSFALLN